MANLLKKHFKLINFTGGTQPKQKSNKFLGFFKQMASGGNNYVPSSAFQCTKYAIRGPGL